MQLAKSLKQIPKYKHAFWKMCILQSYGDYLAANVFIAVIGHTPSMADINSTVGVGARKKTEADKAEDTHASDSNVKTTKKQSKGSKRSGPSDTSTACVDLPLQKLVDLEAELLTVLDEDWRVVDKAKALDIFNRIRDICLVYNTTGGSSPWYGY